MMTRAVKNSPIARAERRAMVIESSIVIFRSTMFSKASLKMGYPPIRAAAMPITLMCGNGSQSRNQTAAAAKPTKAIRASSVHSNPCSCSEWSRLDPSSPDGGSSLVKLRTVCRVSFDQMRSAHMDVPSVAREPLILSTT